MKESDCKVTDCGSHAQHVLTKSDGKVEKDTVTPDEEKDKITCVDEGHDVEHVTATLNHPRHHEIYRRNARDKLRVETGVQIIVGDDTLSMMKLAGRLKNRRLMSLITAWFPTSRPTSCGEQDYLSFSRQANCRMQADGVPFEEKADYMTRFTSSIPKQGVKRQHRVDETAQENSVQSVKGRVHDTEERVVTLRTELLHGEIQCHEREQCESV